MDNVVSLANLFHQRLFRVPDYQRGYSWEGRQVLEFLEDLEVLESNRDHYTGTIVLHRFSVKAHSLMDEDGTPYGQVNIVDGQQRLTTIILLLDSIRARLNEFPERGKKLAEGIKKSFISTTGEDGQPLFKLSLNNDTDYFFKHNILAEQPTTEGPIIASAQRLSMAKKRIGDYLLMQIADTVTSHSDSPDSAEELAVSWLRSLYSKVATQLKFTLYTVSDEAEVGVIFEVMNDRGKPLTALEKVKNFLLHTSVSIQPDNRLAKDVNEAWAAILRQLMAAGRASAADEDRLLRAHWLTNHNPQSRQWKGSSSVKGEFSLRRHKGCHKELLDRLHSYASGLREACTCFCDVYQPYSPGAFQSFGGDQNIKEELAEWTAKLVRMDVVVPFLPILFATRTRWPDDPGKYLQILRLCEIYAFRVYRVKQYRSDAGQATLFRLGHGLARKSESFDGAIGRLKRQIVKLSKVDEFRSWISGENEQIRSAYSWNGLRYFLYEYETTLARSYKDKPDVPWDKWNRRGPYRTIEHILPQSIDDQPSWQARFGEKHERYVHDLGNLTLTLWNSHYGNKPFCAKKGQVDAKEPKYCYAKSPFYAERELALWDDWTPDAIEERQSKLLNWAKDRWEVD